MRIGRAVTCCRYVCVQYEHNMIDTIFFSVGASLLKSIMQVADNIIVIYCLFKRALQFREINNHEAHEIKISKSIFMLIYLYFQFVLKSLKRSFYLVK